VARVAATRADPAPASSVDGAAGGRPITLPAYDPGMPVARRKVLLVEDEQSIVAPLAAALDREGFDAHAVETAAEALEVAARLDPDLVLLDLMLPDGSGFDVCRELRRSGDVPVIMLTARGDEADRIVGLELGADDYVVKPFSAREVIARIRAVLRRTEAASEPEAEGGAMEVGELRLDPGRRSVELAGEPLELSRKEFDLLERLMRDAGSVITREQLIEDVWDMNWFGSTKTLDVHVSSLRRKLGDNSERPRFLHTVRGVGFRFSTTSDLDE
jgi:DNA-binding response OmpR family regulator